MKKKLIVGILLLALMLSAFGTVLAACTDPAAKVDHAVMNQMIEQLDNMYGTKRSANESFTVVGVASIENTKNNIKWTSSNTTAAAVGEMGDNKLVLITITPAATDVTFTLTATLVDADGNDIKDADGKVYAISFEMTIAAAATSEIGAILVTAPVEGTAYKLAVDHKAKGKTYYILNQSNSNQSWYQRSTTDYENAAEAYIENAEGGFYIYLQDEIQGKKYLNLKKSGTHTSIFREDSAISVWTWDADKGCLVTDIYEGTGQGSMGCDSGYDTLGGQYDLATAGEDWYPAFLATIGEIVLTPDALLDKIRVPSSVGGTFALTTIEGVTYSVPAGSAIEMGSIGSSTTTFNVTRGATDTTVTITATAFVGNQSKTKTFDVVVKKAVNVTAGTPAATVLYDKTSQYIAAESTPGSKSVWRESYFTIINEKGSATSFAAAESNTYSNISLYAKTTMKVQYANMRALIITCSDWYSTADFDYQYACGLDTFEAAGCTVVRDGYTIYVTFDSAVNEFDFGAIKSQLRIIKVEVYTDAINVA